ncbi:hypothetical protein IEO70_12420 [Bacillus sp. AGMB 02131]|uniref:PRK06770 family protein n=1 Tax=Peribacillus faecalis TaxID=2772559 RepID=A0A927CWY0_9BACI|nr:DUF6241 domain-containing protein [Peribacillus faecalis]MBD3109153.1 hypothetical protein [Peribacillus faecalis]
MKKKLFIPLIGLIVIGSVAAWYFWQNGGNTSGVKIDNPSEEQIDEGKQVIEDSFNNEKADVEIITGEVTDSKVQSVIHKMSHQKIEADKKWGSLEITKDRLQFLSSEIDENKGNLKHYKTYRDIIDRWLKGDFSRADHDHNAIWRLQNGTIGEATGLLNEAEEAAYIEENFR